MKLQGTAAKLAKELASILDQNFDLYDVMIDIANWELSELTDSNISNILVNLEIQRDVAKLVGQVIHEYFWELASEVYDMLDDPEDSEIDLPTIADYVSGALVQIGKDSRANPNRWDRKATYKILSRYYTRMFKDLL